MRQRVFWLCLLGGLSVLPAFAGPATHLTVYIPCVTVCLGGEAFHLVDAGQPFPLFVGALDANNDYDANYRGTVVFGSSDPLATLPGSYTFTAADQGGHVFLDAETLRTLGTQTLSVHDTAAPAISGAWTVTVLSPSAPIPVTTPVGTLALVALLAAGGVWFITRSS